MLAGKYLFSFFLKNPGIYFQSPIIFFFILMPFFSLVYNFFIAYYRNEQKLLQYSILNLSTFAGMTIGTLAGVIFLKLDVLGAIAGRTIGYGFFVILFLIIHIFSEGIRWNARFAKRILLFGLPIFVYLAIGQISLIVDRLMIERFFDLGELGIYGLAMIMASVVEIWIGAISNAISPLIYRYIKTNIEENAEKIRFLFKIQYLCVLVMICFIIAVAKPMADLLFSDKFREAVYYVPVLAVSFAARALYIVRMPIVFSYNKTKYLSLIHVVSLIVSVGFSFLFMPYLGVLGIAIAVLMTKFSQVIMAVFFSNKVYNFSYKFSRYYIITLLLLVNVTVIYLFYQKINPYLLLSSPLALFISYFAFQKRELKEIVAFIKARS
jgi:O-antigen/teichoic acid export membrane protein